jgi:uncharacterized protein
VNKFGVPDSWWRKFRYQGKELLKDLHFFWRGALVLVALGFFLYLGTLLMLVFSQEKIIFRAPTGFSENLPVVGLEHKALTMDWAGGEAQAMYWEKAGAPGVLVFCYGNAGSVQGLHRRVKWLAEKMRLSIFVADYPGYGETSGEPGQGAILELMGLWMKRLTTDMNFGPERRIFWGHSLGGAVATQLVKEHGAAGLILENTFNNMEEMGSVVYPWMPLGWVLRHPFASDVALEDWDGPVLQFHSRLDGVVPFQLGKRLGEALKKRGPYLWVETGGFHNEGYLEFSSEIWDGVDQFSKLLSSPFLGLELRGGRSSGLETSRLQNDTRR